MQIYYLQCQYFLLYYCFESVFHVFASVSGVAPVAIHLPTHIAVCIVFIYGLYSNFTQRSSFFPPSCSHLLQLVCVCSGSLSHLAKQQNAAEALKADNTHRVHARCERSGVCKDVSPLFDETESDPMTIQTSMIISAFGFRLVINTNCHKCFVKKHQLRA